MAAYANKAIAVHNTMALAWQLSEFGDPKTQAQRICSYENLVTDGNRKKCIKVNQILHLKALLA